MALGDYYSARLRATRKTLFGVGKGTLDLSALSAARAFTFPDADTRLGPTLADADGLRPTLVSGTPYTTGDQLAKASLFLTPCTSKQAAEFDASGNPTVYATGEVSLAASGSVTTAGRWHDVFSYYSAGGGAFGPRGTGVAGGTASTSGTAYVATLPTSVAGDLLTLAVVIDSGGGTVPTPLGWTPRLVASVAGTPASSLFTKISAGETSVSITVVNATPIRYGSHAFVSAAYDTGLAGGGGSGISTVDAPSITPNASGNYLLGYFLAASGPTWTGPAGPTKAQAAGALGEYELLASAAATGTRTATVPGGSATYLVSYSVSLKSNVAAPGVYLELSAPYSAGGVATDSVARNALGVAVKAADPTRKLVATVYAPTTTTFEDSLAFPMRRVNFPSRANYSFDTRGFCAVDALVYDRLNPPANAETALAATATVTLTGRRYSLPGGGTTTLPQATAANLGQLVSLRVVPAATAIQQVTAPTSTVGGRAAGDFRVWAGESVELESDGTNWLVRPGGVCLPLSCGLYLSASQVLAATTYTRVTLNQTDGDNSGLMAGVVTNGISVPRKNWYAVTTKGLYRAATGGGGVAAQTYVQLFVQVNQATVGAPNAIATTVSRTMPSGGIDGSGETKRLLLAAGDYVHLGVYGSGAFSLDAGVAATSLQLVEVPGW